MRAYRLALVYAVMLCVILPWTIRNVKTLGAPVLVSTNFGVNFWMGNHEGAPGTYEFTPEMEAAAERIHDEVAFDAYARGRALSFIGEHPGQAVILAARKILILWSPAMDGVKAVFPRDRSFQSKAFAVLHRLAHGIVLGLFLAALLRRRPIPGVVWATLVYYTVVYTTIVALPRYNFPAIPWLIIGAAAILLPREGEERERIP